MDKKSERVIKDDEELPSLASQKRSFRKSFTAKPRKEKQTGLTPTVSSPLPQPPAGRKASDSVRPSTIPTPLRNDPMYDEIDCDDFVGLSELKNRRTLAISNESYLPLVDREYDLRSVSDKRFGVIVSRSCYRYVMMIHLCARYAQLRDLRGLAERDENNLLTHLKGKAYVLSPAIDSYLRSIGDFADASGKHHRLDIPVWRNADGDFGRVDAETHWNYMAYLAPRIFTQAVVADLRYTTRVDDARE